MGFRPIATRLRLAGRHTKGRRIRLGLLVAAVALGFVFPNSTASGQTVPPGILPSNQTFTPEQAQWLVGGVRYAEQVLPQYYGNRSTLQSQGYTNIGVIAPGGYEHWVNVNMFNDQHFLNPRYPESLVFQRLPNGTYELQAAMLFSDATVTLQTLPQMVRFIPGWHAHPELCSDDTGRVVGFNFGQGCSAGHQALVPMIHVWTKDPGCGHRFGGLGVTGLQCNYEDMDEHGDHGAH